MFWPTSMLYELVKVSFSLSVKRVETVPARLGLFKQTTNWTRRLSTLAAATSSEIWAQKQWPYSALIDSMRAVHYAEYH